MKLYHFTAISKLKSILGEGLTRGEVVVDFNDVLNGVNLTNDPSSSGHGLCNAEFLTPELTDKLGLQLAATRPVPFFPNKRKVRITVNVPNGSVTRWLRWASKNVDDGTREALIRSGGGIAKARSWYFSFDPIPTDRFVSVEIRQHGEWIAYHEYKGTMEEEFSDQAMLTGYRHWGDRLRVGRTQSFLDQLDQALASESAGAA